MWENNSIGIYFIGYSGTYENGQKPVRQKLFFLSLKENQNRVLRKLTNIFTHDKVVYGKINENERSRWRTINCTNFKVLNVFEWNKLIKKCI